MVTFVAILILAVRIRARRSARFRYDRSPVKGGGESSRRGHFVPLAPAPAGRCEAVR
jgi:hypothetical protein